MDQTEFLLEYYKIAREEIMLRIRTRDNLMKIQLVILIVIAALSLKMNFIISTDKEIPEILILALPISIITCALYFVEDNIIGRLALYSEAVSYAEKEINKSELILFNWEASNQIKDFLKETLEKRIIAQYIAFLILPFIYNVVGILLFIPKICCDNILSLLLVISIVVSTLSVIFIFYLIFTGNKLRKEARTSKPVNIFIKNQINENTM